jgi:hypothetical protein
VSWRCALKFVPGWDVCSHGPSLRLVFRESTFLGDEETTRKDAGQKIVASSLAREKYITLPYGSWLILGLGATATLSEWLELPMTSAAEPPRCLPGLAHR